MPKDRRIRSTHHHQSRTCPVPSCSKTAKQDKYKNLTGLDNDANKDVNEWEEVRCPICLEHPHSAVLLRCSSYGKGCRPYLCNTSYRHSNCLSQFCASSSKQQEAHPLSKSKLVCPLCRGQVSGWDVIEPARHFMNSKARSCPYEACDFCGTYVQLRNHTRREHPVSWPSQVDPARRQEWIRLERETELNDAICLFLSQFQYIGFEDMLRIHILHSGLLTPVESLP
ncbi:hypothetical protein I3842_03G242000 [Carya illinoinensis]|uniref:Uncharacterized protein n=1 Tax=Carya illinoinensis TaxID=32201 RepID=A0A922JX19_CARIL|nr:hypothetical protein I3842_03G242000 [Carya illinoinensis]